MMCNMRHLVYWKGFAHVGTKYRFAIDYRMIFGNARSRGKVVISSNDLCGQCQYEYERILMIWMDVVFRYGDGGGLWQSNHCIFFIRGCIAKLAFGQLRNFQWDYKSTSQMKQSKVAAYRFDLEQMEKWQRPVMWSHYSCRLYFASVVGTFPGKGRC